MRIFSGTGMVLVVVSTGLMLSLVTCLFIGCDMAMRPGNYLCRDGRRGLPALLDSLTRRLEPRLDRSVACRLAGATIAAVAFAGACTIAFGLMSYLAQGSF